MKKGMSERRLVENQVMFRQTNFKVVKRLKELENVAKEEGQEDWVPDTNQPILFYCECSDENCRKRIELKPSRYLELHQNESQFIVLPGHQVLKVERIIKSEKDYLVVEKYVTPPTKVKRLHQTDVDHK